MIYIILLGGIGGYNGGIGLSLLSETFQLDLGGLFIHIGDDDEDEDEDDNSDDVKEGCGDAGRFVDDDKERCLKGGRPCDSRGKGGIRFDGKNDDAEDECDGNGRFSGDF